MGFHHRASRSRSGVRQLHGVAEVIAERTQQLLHDRMVAFHVQRQLSVPLSTSEFLGGLNQRYPERDGMYFLPTQVTDTTGNETPLQNYAS